MIFFSLYQKLLRLIFPGRNYCPECGGRMRWETRDRSIIGRSGGVFELKNTGWWCMTCGEAILEGGQLQKAEDVFENMYDGKS